MVRKGGANNITNSLRQSGSSPIGKIIFIVFIIILIIIIIVIISWAVSAANKANKSPHNIQWLPINSSNCVIYSQSQYNDED